MRLEQFLDFRILDNGKYIEPSIDYANGIINISFKVENKDLEIELFSGRKDSEGNKIYGKVKRIRKKEEVIELSEEEMGIQRTIRHTIPCEVYGKTLKETLAYLIGNKIAKDLKEASSYIIKATTHQLDLQKIITGIVGYGAFFDKYINKPNELIHLIESVLSLEYLSLEQLYNLLCYEVDNFNIALKAFRQTSGKNPSTQSLLDFFVAMQDKYKELKEYDLFYNINEEYEQRNRNIFIIASHSKNTYIGIYWDKFKSVFALYGFAIYNPEQENVFSSKDYIKKYHKLLRENEKLLNLKFI